MPGGPFCAAPSSLQPSASHPCAAAAPRRRAFGAQASTAVDNRALLVGTLNALGDGASIGEAVAAAVGRAALLEKPPPSPPPGEAPPLVDNARGAKPTSAGKGGAPPGKGSPKNRPGTPTKGKVGTPRAEEAPPLPVAPEPEPLPRRCSVLAPIVYGAPLVRMGGSLSPDPRGAKGGGKK